MAFNAVDYFATLGKTDGKFTPKEFPSPFVDDRTVFTTSEVWQNAITDIAVVGQVDELDSSWTTISKSVEGEELDSPFVAFKRRKDSKRPDHITEVCVIADGGVVPSGFELIVSGDTNGNMANLQGFVAVKRANTGATSLIFADPTIDEIVLLLNEIEEELPEKFKDVDIVRARPVSTTGNNSNNSNNNKNNNNNTITSDELPPCSLAIHRRPGMGLCDLGYQSSTIDRYPLKDYKTMPLPVQELPMFVFPNDLRLTYSPQKRFPMPLFFTLVFTDQNGSPSYTACLKFYEQVAVAEIESAVLEFYGAGAKFEMPAGGAIFCPKVVTVISRIPFYRAMRRFLRQIYSLSLSTIPRPLEMYIGSLVGSVPLPVEGGRPFHLMLDAALISQGSKAMAPVALELPEQRFFPPMDLDFAAPLRCLAVDHFLAVFTLMLREAKILFVSASNALLTETMETLRSLLFPLSWASCFVPRLPSALTGLLEAPGGFMIGLHVDVGCAHDENNDNGFGSSSSGGGGGGGGEDPGLGSQQDERSHEFKVMRAYIDRLHREQPLVPDTYIVDLTNDSMYIFDGRNNPSELTTTSIDRILSLLPHGPRLRLRWHLLNIAKDYKIGPQLAARDEFDSAFELQQSFIEEEDAEGNSLQVSSAKWEQFPTLQLRDSFMAFIADILGNFQRYMIPPSEDMAADTYRTFKEEFYVNKYIEDAGPPESGLRLLIESIMESQMFAVLLQKRSEGIDYGLVFFEEAAELMRELGLSVGGHTSSMMTAGAGSNASNNAGELSLQERGRNLLSGGSSIGGVCCVLPAPLYKLLAADKQWKVLAPEKQESILSSVGSDSHIATALTYLIQHTTNGKDRDSNTPTTSPTRSGVHAMQQQLQQKNAFNSVTTKTTLAQNETLKHLLCLLHHRAMIDSVERHDLFSDPAADSHIGHSHSHAEKNQLAFIRNELSRNQELHLDNSACGPLVLPGPMRPSKKFISSSRPPESGNGNDSSGSDQATAEKTEFSYRDGWPSLGSTASFSDPENVLFPALHPRLSQLMKDRRDAVEMANKSVLLFIRPPAERLSFQHRGRLQCLALSAVATTGAHDQKSKSSHSNDNSSISREDTEVSLSISLCDAATVSVTMLAMRCIEYPGPASAGDVLQMLGIISQLEQLRVLHLIHESTWRAILVACTACGGDLMRRVACVVYESLRAAVPNGPDPLSFGQYLQALSAKALNNPLDEQNPLPQLDCFLYLEEMGYTWYIQRSALIEQFNVAQAHNQQQLLNAAASEKRSFFGSKSARGSSIGGESESSQGRPSLSVKFSESFKFGRNSSVGGSNAHTLGVLDSSNSRDGADGVRPASTRRVVRAYTESARMIAEQLSLVRGAGGAAMPTSSAKGPSLHSGKNSSSGGDSAEDNTNTEKLLCLWSPEEMAHCWYASPIPMASVVLTTDTEIVATQVTKRWEQLHSDAYRPEHIILSPVVSPSTNNSNATSNGILSSDGRSASTDKRDNSEGTEKKIMGGLFSFSRKSEDKRRSLSPPPSRSAGTGSSYSGSSGTSNSTGTEEPSRWGKFNSMLRKSSGGTSSPLPDNKSIGGGGGGGGGLLSAVPEETPRRLAEANAVSPTVISSGVKVVKNLAAAETTFFEDDDVSEAEDSSSDEENGSVFRKQRRPSSKKIAASGAMDAGADAGAGNAATAALSAAVDDPAVIVPTMTDDAAANDLTDDDCTAEAVEGKEKASSTDAATATTAVGIVENKVVVDGVSFHFSSAARPPLETPKKEPPPPTTTTTTTTTVAAIDAANASTALSLSPSAEDESIRPAPPAPSSLPPTATSLAVKSSDDKTQLLSTMLHQLFRAVEDEALAVEEGDTADAAKVASVPLHNNTDELLLDSKRVNNSNNNHHHHRRIVIGIHSATPCRHCGFVMMEEELVNMWNQQRIQKMNLADAAEAAAAVSTHVLMDAKSSSSSFATTAAPQGGAVATSSETDDDSGSGENGSSSSSSAVGDVVEAAAAAAAAGSQKKKSRDLLLRDMNVLHSVCCPQCAKMFAPQLHVRAFVPSSSSSLSGTGSSCSRTATSSSSSSNSNVQVLWYENVNYLSPFGVRYVIEDIVSRCGGAKACDAQWMKRHHPAAFWSSQWHAARLHLPSGFSADSATTTTTAAIRSMISGGQGAAVGDGGNDVAGDVPLQRLGGPVLVGWRAHIVQARAAAVFDTYDRKQQPQTASAQTSVCVDSTATTGILSLTPPLTSAAAAATATVSHLSRINLQLSAVFPLCTSAELEKIELFVIAQLLDTSLTGMRVAMLEFSQCTGALNLFPLLENTLAAAAAAATTPAVTTVDSASIPVTGTDDGEEEADSTAIMPLSRNRLSLCVQSNNANGKAATARCIYVGLLTLFALYVEGNPKTLSTSYKNSSSQKQQQPQSGPGLRAFDKLFMESIKCVVSKADLDQMKTNEEELLECVATVEVQRVRGAFGLLI